MKPAISILLTRPKEGSERFAQMLHSWIGTRARIVIAPLLEIKSTGAAPDLSDYRGAIFTSLNGVEHAPNANLPAYCVGVRTAEAARTAGWRAECLGLDAEEFVPALRARGPAGPLVHLCGTYRRGNIAEKMTASGVVTTPVEVYDPTLLPLSREASEVLEREEPCIIPLFSPRTARHFADVARATAPLHLILISAAAEKEVRGIASASQQIANRPDAQSMELALRAALERVEAHLPPG